MENISIENGIYGTRAVIKSNWNPSYERFLLNEHIAELELNDAKGWHGEDILFVKSFNNLQALTIIDLKIKSVEPIHYLPQLRKLEVITYCNTKIDFNLFPMLEDCGFEWRLGAKSIFDCKNLRLLYINRYSGKDTKDFARLVTLQELTILNSPIENLLGLSTLNQLRKLRIGNLKHLTSLAGIDKLSNLEALEIQKCKKINSIQEVINLNQLKILHINDSGDIESLNPLKHLDTLESVSFYESTNIVDGDLSPLIGKNKLMRVSFQNRRHYSHRREEFGV
jgi:hypothetical protein